MKARWWLKDATGEGEKKGGRGRGATALDKHQVNRTSGGQGMIKTGLEWARTGL